MCSSTIFRQCHTGKAIGDRKKIELMNMLIIDKALAQSKKSVAESNEHFKSFSPFRRFFVGTGIASVMGIMASAHASSETWGMIFTGGLMGSIMFYAAASPRDHNWFDKCKLKLFESVKAGRELDFWTLNRMCHTGFRSDFEVVKAIAKLRPSNHINILVQQGMDDIAAQVDEIEQHMPY